MCERTEDGIKEYREVTRACMGWCGQLCRDEEKMGIWALYWLIWEDGDCTDGNVRGLWGECGDRVDGDKGECRICEWEDGENGMGRYRKV